MNPTPRFLRRWVPVTVPALLVLLGLAVPRHAAAYSGEDFLEELRAKFRTTSNIYLEARTVRLTEGETQGDSVTSKDTTSITLAYAYPKRFLQRMRGQSERRQNVIMKDDQMVISYPHLDFYEEYDLREGDVRRLLVEHIPLAGALMGLSQGAVEEDAITARVEGDHVLVTIRSQREKFPFRSMRGKFSRDNLEPEFFILRGKRNFRLDILKYVEEERFPRWVERAFENMDVNEMEDVSQ